MSKLVEKLTAEDANWRTNTVVLIDGAKYQTCAESLDYMKDLGIKVCVSAPYSYSATPIEYAFAQFKRGELNPEGQKAKKR
jgi:hypothetical protein